MIQEYRIWLVATHIKAVSPCFHLVGASAFLTAGGAPGLLLQRMIRVAPRSKMYNAKLVCLSLGLQFNKAYVQPAKHVAKATAATSARVPY